MFKGNNAISAGNKTIRRIALLLLCMLLASELHLPARANAQPPPVAPATALSSSELKLIGTIRSSSFTGAVFSDNAGIQYFFQLYDQLPDGFKLVKLSAKSIVLKNADGLQYELFVSQNVNTVGQRSQSAPPAAIEQPLKQEEQEE